MPTVRKLTSEEVRQVWKDTTTVDSPVAQPVRAPLPLPRNLDRVLLLHPPIVDIRIPWAQYIQPIRLLRLATFFRNAGVDVRLVDSVASIDRKPLRRAQVRKLVIEGKELNVWRWGMSPAAIEKTLRALQRELWTPDIVYVECATTFWWEGATEIIAAAKASFPTSRVVLLGPYGELAPEHARENTVADDIGQLDWAEISQLAPDLSHYETKPASIYLSLADGVRRPEDVVEEINDLQTRYNAQSFAFLDHAITTHHPDTFRRVLEAIASQGLKVRLVALGNLPMHDLVAHPDLAQVMKRAGYAQIFFADDRHAVQSVAAEQTLIDDAAQVAEICRTAGFQIRTDAITASLCLGRPGESLERRAKTATYLAHHLGSLIFWPYQPNPNELPGIPLENQNGKFFPMRTRNNASFKDYHSVLGLASVLNAKYHAVTFDFLGDGVMARLFRESIERQAWSPPEDVKGTLKLPMVK